MPFGGAWNAAWSWAVSAPGKWFKKRRGWHVEAIAANGVRASGRERWGAPAFFRSPRGMWSFRWFWMSLRSASTTDGWRTGSSSTSGLSRQLLSAMCPWRWTPTQCIAWGSASPMGWATWATPFGTLWWQTLRKLEGIHHVADKRIQNWVHQGRPPPILFSFLFCIEAHGSSLLHADSFAARGTTTWAHSHQSVGTHRLDQQASSGDRPQTDDRQKVGSGQQLSIQASVLHFHIEFSFGFSVWGLCTLRPSCVWDFIPAPITDLKLVKWRHWKPSRIKELGPINQKVLEGHLRRKWAERLLAHLTPHTEEIAHLGTMRNRSSMIYLEIPVFGHSVRGAWFWNKCSNGTCQSPGKRVMLGSFSTASGLRKSLPTSSNSVGTHYVGSPDRAHSCSGTASQESQSPT